MHQSATRATGLRERRTARTARRLISTARAWTAERGLAGFTVEELCAEVEVSRRTFFNYFAKKEHAVLGIRTHDTELDRVAQEFLHSTEPLVTALITLSRRRWEILGHGFEDHAELMNALRQEPELHALMVEFAARIEHADAELVAEREGWAADDTRAITAVTLVGTFGRAVATEQFAADRPLSPTHFAERLSERLQQAAAMLTSTPETTTERNRP
ncbi:TetR/AcrR family transcriptional regulator [Naumannella halotolerans]|uniref:Regulatory TetR family protein n=1 Tax=Naumannella halotolerans TaxID=993414 RepID=A0A4R7J6B2_9ACTN|nr:TetR family transcriptional regulator [Naumannella halotolerans]TDT32910.1 regulatory TetR family protein [Naumannella halotolerans]